MKDFLRYLLIVPFLFCFSFAEKSYAATANAITVKKTLAFAFAYSPNVKAAQEARQQTVHNVRAAEAGYYPTIGIWAGAGLQQSNTPSTRISKRDPYTVGTTNMGFQISQPLWTGGRTAASVRAQEENMLYQGWQLMDSANSLAYSAISAHADVLRRRELVKLSKANLLENKKILNTLRWRYQQGLSSEGDVRLLEGRIGRAEASLAAHVQGLHTAMATYTRITGQPTPQHLQALSMPKAIITNVDVARDISVNKNFRIQADLAAIRSALAGVDVARAAFSPTLSVDAGPTYSSNAYDDDQYQWTWSVMLNLQWDFYSGGRDVATVKSQAARVRELRQILHQTMDQLNEELLATYAATKASKAQVQSYAKAANAAKLARVNYTAQFDVGRKDLFSVLDAEDEYHASIMEKVIAQTDAVLGEYRMLALTGELLDELNIDRDALKIDTSLRAQPTSVMPWSFAPSQLNEDEALSGTTLTSPR